MTTATENNSLNGLAAGTISKTAGRLGAGLGATIGSKVNHNFVVNAPASMIGAAVGADKGRRLRAALGALGGNLARGAGELEMLGKAGERLAPTFPGLLAAIAHGGKGSAKAMDELGAILSKTKTSGAKRDPRLERAGVYGFNKPKRTPGHPTKSHIVVAKVGDTVKTIRFGQQGVKTNQTAGQRKAFKSRHAKNIARGKLSAAYWADRVKWSASNTKDKDNQKWVKGS